MSKRFFLALITSFVTLELLGAVITVTPGGDIAAAVSSAAAGDTIEVGEGAYALAAPIVVDKDVALVAPNGATLTGNGAETSLLHVTSPGAFVSGFTLRDAKVDSASKTPRTDCALYLTSGTVSNCVVASCQIAYDQWQNPGAGCVTVTGGLLTHCVISNNVGTGSLNEGAVGLLFAGSSTSIVRNSIIAFNQCQNLQTISVGVRMVGNANSRLVDCEIYGNKGNAAGTGYGAAGLYLDSGTVDRCVIANNTNTYYEVGGTRICSGGVYATGTSKIRNSLIVGNKTNRSPAGNAGGITLSSSATGENLTIVDNSNENTGSVDGVYIRTTTASLKNSIIAYNGGADGPDLYSVGTLVTYCCYTNAVPPAGSNQNVPPNFINRSIGNYHLSSVDTSCIDKGNDSVFVVGDLDLDGNPRRSFDHVDIGCFERQPRAGTCMTIR